MAQKKREESGEGALRLSTIIEQRQVSPMEAAAVMKANGLKTSDRMEPERFLQLVADWKSLPARSN